MTHVGQGMANRGETRPTVFIAHPSDLLTDHMPNGDGLVAHGFLNELARRGYRLHIATPGTALREQLPGDVTIHEIRRRFRNPVLERLHYMWAIRKLLHRLRRTERIDLVHQMNPVFVGLSLGLLGCRLPIVLGTFVARWPNGEELEPRRRTAKAIGAGLRWLINLVQQLHADVMLVTTAAAVNRIAAPCLVRRKMKLLPHGIDEKLFSPGPSWERDRGAPTILFYSHLDRRKGVFDLIRAFEEVARQVPESRLLLVGRGIHEAEVRELIRRHPFADRIELHGPIPRGEAPALMRAYGVYCLPSYGEPYGMTALEAMACGCALVVTDSGGLADLLPDGGGLRTRAGDPVALAAALIALLQSPERQRSMGATNRAHVERDHTWSSVTDRLETIYAEVLSGARPHDAGPELAASYVAKA